MIKARSGDNNDGKRDMSTFKAREKLLFAYNTMHKIAPHFMILCNFIMRCKCFQPNIMYENHKMKINLDNLSSVFSQMAFCIP